MNYSIKGDLSSKEIGGELFIYNRKNSTMYSFNGTGVFIWNMIKQNMAIDEIGHRLCEEYDVLPAIAAKDVSDFINDIKDNGLVSFLKEKENGDRIHT